MHASLIRVPDKPISMIVNIEHYIMFLPAAKGQQKQKRTMDAHTETKQQREKKEEE